MPAARSGARGCGERAMWSRICVTGPVHASTASTTRSMSFVVSLMPPRGRAGPEFAPPAVKIRASTVDRARGIGQDRCVSYTRAIAGSLALATVVAAALTVVGLAASGVRDPGAWDVAGLVLLAAGTAGPACVGAVLLARRPGTRVAWMLLVGAFSVGLVMAAFGVSTWLLAEDAASTAGAWTLVAAQEWPVLFAWPVALAFVYPDGHLPSPRWRVPAALALASFAGAMLLLLLQDPLPGEDGRDVANPLGVTAPDVLVPVFWACWAGVLLSLVGGALALHTRYRRGGRTERRQVLWLAYGALIPPLWLGGSSLAAAVLGVRVSADLVVLGALQAWLAVAVAVAVTRHGLYGIDRLFARTLVYAVLTAGLAGTYALVALAAGQLAGGSALGASLGTLAAALAFRPLRDRLQRVVDRRFARARVEGVRLVAGFLDDVRSGRAEPEEVGAVLALALHDPGAEVLFRLPESGTYADRLGHQVERPGEGARATTPIGRDDREVGRLRVELRLQLQAVESSRARIAQAGYAERRRLERDLHDGAQQRLVTLGIVLRRIQRSLPREARLLGPSFDAAVDEVAATIGDLRTLAAGLRPPRLDEGLAAALEDLARGAAVPVEVEASGDRAPPDLEAVAYFIACEALTNAVKHGSPSRVTMHAVREPATLRLVVADDGVGGAAANGGSGLAGMADRVAAQGGTLAVHSPAGAGTRIEVELPCAS
jgi:signal transduction histidine kinase